MFASFLLVRYELRYLFSFYLPHPVSPPAYCRDYTRVEIVWHSTEREEEKRKIKTFHNPLEKKVISLKLNLHCVLARILSLYMRLRQDTEKKRYDILMMLYDKVQFQSRNPFTPSSAWNVRPLRIDQLLFTSKMTTTAAVETRVSSELTTAFSYAHFSGMKSRCLGKFKSVEEL